MNFGCSLTQGICSRSSPPASRKDLAAFLGDFFQCFEAVCGEGRTDDFDALVAVFGELLQRLDRCMGAAKVRGRGATGR